LPSDEVASLQPAEADVWRDITAWSTERGIRFVQDSPAPISLDDARLAMAELKKIPDALWRHFKQHRTGIDFICAYGVTSHWSARDLKGKVVEKYEDNSTWDHVAGIGGYPGTPAVVCINYLRLFRLTDRCNVILHELGHVFDDIQRHSTQQDWHALWRQPDWKRSRYQTKYPEECFAESFSAYFNSRETRLALPATVREYFAEILTAAGVEP
jgi:hypothetical protein